MVGPFFSAVVRRTEGSFGGAAAVAVGMALACWFATGADARAAGSEPAPRIGLSASLFATDPEGPVNNVALMWAATGEYDSFEIHRGDGGSFRSIHVEKGTSLHDYGLPPGTFHYRLIANSQGVQRTSRVARVSTMAMPDGLREYSNQRFRGTSFPKEPVKVGSTYYTFEREHEDGRRIKLIRQRTSIDGETWKDGPVVMDQSSHPDLADCKFESGTSFYDERSGRIVWWCHWERSGRSYAHGRAMVATAKPGEPFTVHHVYNPLGIQVRDMSVFVDDDKEGYLVAASNEPGQGANATLYIFKLDETYNDVTGVVNKVMEDRYREAPHIIKRDGFYYLFFSQAAGWYPSQAAYVSARSLDGRWSDLRTLANPATFSCQAGEVIEFGHGQATRPLMLANRWIRSEETARQVALPIHCDQGFAFCDFAPTVLHDSDRNLVVPLQEGVLLSQGRPATASIPGQEGHGIEKAFDGDYDSFFRSDEKTWPFSVTVDLGATSLVENVQISWHLHKGSEAFYQYTIEGSLDGEAWEVMLDRADREDPVVSRTYGFTSDLLPDPAHARHVRLNVHQAVLHNNPHNWYPPTLYEVRVFGSASP